MSYYIIFLKIKQEKCEEHNNQSTEAFARIEFVRSCFCPITTLIEPSIILSSYIFRPEEARHKRLYMKPGTSMLSDSRDSLQSTKITRRRKQEVMVPENDTCQIQNFDFISHVFGPAAQSGQARTPTQLTLHMGACWGTQVKTNCGVE